MKKTPISYYGGKQRLVPKLLPLIPDHKQYVEPLCGGAALFWAKEPSTHEVLNDADQRVINFWEVVQDARLFAQLAPRIATVLNAEHYHQRAAAILRAPLGRTARSKVAYAWAFWVQANMSFSSRLLGGWGFGCNTADAGSEATSLANRRAAFSQKLQQRLTNVDIFSRDAVDVIGKHNRPDVFMYLDPPYPDSDCGHYATRRDVFERVLDVLPTLKCKWLLSSYPSERLDLLREAHSWHRDDEEMKLSVSGKLNAGKIKTECLTWNYSIQQEPIGLFAAQHLPPRTSKPLITA